VSELLTLVVPVVALAVVAGAVAVLPRRLGHALGVLATLGLIAWSFAVPAGTYWEATFLGFDAVFLHVDAFSRLMGIIFGIIGSAAVLYAYASKASRTMTAIALSYVATSTGAVFAGDWLVLLFCWELMAVTSTVLVWHNGGQAVRAGFRYALAHGIGGTLLMAGIVWHYAEVGSFLFSQSAGLTPGLPAALAAAGIGVNVGFVGLHAWLPDTYPRPHIAASVFLCVFTTKTGVYGMYRAFPDGHLLIAHMGAAMAVFGVTYALFQNDMRRLLSYHIQSQVGYMIAGVGIPSALATAGAMAHVYNHILYKALLFMTAGVVIYRTGQENLKDLGGLASKMPATAVAFTVAALSISGFPGFNGFVSKGMVTAAAHEAHLDTIYWLLIIGGVGTFMSFIKFGYYAFYRGSYDGLVTDANRGQTVAMGAIATLCVLYGVYPEALFAILPGTGAAEAHPFTTSHVIEGLAIAGVALVAFVAIKRPLSRVHGVPDVDAIYNPLVFGGTRRLTGLVLRGGSLLDRAAVGVTRGSTARIRAPERSLSALPWLGTRIKTENESGNPWPLRAGIGTSALLVAASLGLALYVVL
jgi:multicomponent Na+:H+ antiporter subunit D